MKFILSILAATAVAAGTASAQLPTEGTINNLNIRLTCQTAGPETVNTNVRTERRTVRYDTTRVNNQTILELLQTANLINETRGWRLVQVFDRDGVNIGIFANRRDFPPVLVPDSILSWTDPTDLVTIYSRTEDLSEGQLTQDDTRTLGTLNIQYDGTKDAAGTISCITRLRTLRSPESIVRWRTVTCSANVTGVSGGVSVTGSISSGGGSRLTNIQDYVDAVAD
ncbi:MAG: hypothetical protein AAGB14_14430 [Verrucomicrobiota bacterium]